MLALTVTGDYMEQPVPYRFTSYEYQGRLYAYDIGILGIYTHIFCFTSLMPALFTSFSVCSLHLMSSVGQSVREEKNAAEPPATALCSVSNSSVFLP